MQCGPHLEGDGVAVGGVVHVLQLAKGGGGQLLGHRGKKVEDFALVAFEQLRVVAHLAGAWNGRTSAECQVARRDWTVPF